MRTCVLVGIGMMVLALSQLSAEDQAATRQKEEKASPAAQTQTADGALGQKEAQDELAGVPPISRHLMERMADELSGAGQSAPAQESGTGVSYVTVRELVDEIVLSDTQTASTSEPIVVEEALVTRGGAVMTGHITRTSDKVIVKSEDGTLVLPAGRILCTASTSITCDRLGPDTVRLEMYITWRVPEDWLGQSKGGSAGKGQTVALGQPAPVSRPSVRAATRLLRPVASDYPFEQRPSQERPIQRPLLQDQERPIQRSLLQEMVCGACGGTGNGTVTCGTCHGTGLWGIGSSACPVCHGRRFTQCATCNGTGRATR